MLGEVFRRAKLPTGVMNIVFGDGPGAGSALVKSPYVQGVSFTGGTSTGIRIRRDTVADIGKHLSLELGGSNPTLVFEDADLSRAVPVAARAAFENSGQICLCGSRIYVHGASYHEFLARFTAYVQSQYWCVGPVVSREHYAKVRSYLVQAQDEDATFETGEIPDEVPKHGFWIKPTVLSDICTDSRVVRGKIFGPVATVCSFDTEDQAIILANYNSNGLASIVLTNNFLRMRRVGEQIDTGLVWANCWLVRELGTAFGGMKASGTGREGGAHTPCPSINIAMAPQNTAYFRPSNHAQGLANYPHARTVQSRDGSRTYIYVSGTSSRRGDGTFVGAICSENAAGTASLTLDIRQQTAAVLSNIDAIIQGATESRAGIDQVLDATVFLANMRDDYTGMNEEWNRVWP